MAIQFKQDLAWTDDRQLVMNDKCREVLEKAKTGGIETKPIGKSGWHVARISTRVGCAKDAYSFQAPNCPECGEPHGGGGSIWAEHQISAPKTPNTFFTTEVARVASAYADREVFLTEDVYSVLRDGKIKGPHCERLQSDPEIAKRAEMKEKGTQWLPPGMTKYLSGK